MAWNLNIELKTNLVLYFGDKTNKIGSLFITSISQNHTDRRRFLDLGKPFSSRIKDFKIALNEGNGTLEFVIKALRYEDSGLLIVTNELGRDLEADHNVTLNVKGIKPSSCLFLD